MPAKPEFPSRDFRSEAFYQASNCAAALVLLQPEIDAEIHSSKTQIIEIHHSGGRDCLLPSRSLSRHQSIDADPSFHGRRSDLAFARDLLPRSPTIKTSKTNLTGINGSPPPLHLLSENCLLTVWDFMNHQGLTQKYHCAFPNQPNFSRGILIRTCEANPRTEA
ncbi:hypothetical protein U1Q18_039579 [Sarracenia purpurea var. burkii]